MQVNPEDSPPDIYVTWSNPRMTDFKNSRCCLRKKFFVDDTDADKDPGADMSQQA